MTEIIKIKVTPKSTVKGKMDVRFPANVVGANFLTITRANGTYTFGVDYTLLGPGPITDPTTAIIAILDQTAGVYKEVSLSSLLTSGLDADLQAIAALTGTGILSRTAANTWLVRAITAGASIGVTNGDGVAGNPTISVTDAELVALAGLISAADQLPYFTGSGTAALASFPTFGRSIAAASSQAAARTVLALTPGTDVQAFDSDLAALAANASTGLWAVTGAGTGSVRTLTAPAAGITVSNGGGVAGNPTLVLANDLAALEGLSSTGIARRTATDTWSVGTLVTNAELATMAAYTIKGNATGSTAAPTDIDITALTSKASPVSGDIVLIQDSAASNAFKKTTVGALASAGSVASIAGNTGAFTLTGGITNSTNAIKLSLTNAALQTTAVSPVASTTAAGVMMGLGGTCTLTPTYSGRIKLDFQFNIANSSASSSNIVTVRFGTGSAPLNGAAVSGTQVGSSLNYQAQASAWIIPVTTTGIILSLTPGTAYWFDLTVGPSTGTATISSVTCNAFEF